MTASVVQQVLCRAAGVRLFDDVFERAAEYPYAPRWLRARARGRLSTAVRERGVLFVHVPKNAGTAIIDALYGTPLGHRSIRCCLWLDEALCDAVSKFAVLRDPAARALSAYQMVASGRSEHVEIHSSYLNDFKNISNIDQYLDFVEARRSNIYGLDAVMRPQSWYVVDQLGKVAVDKLFVLGEQDRELADFLAMHSPRPLRQLNRAVRSHAVLSPRQHQRIRNIYASDYALIEAAIAKREPPTFRCVPGHFPLLVDSAARLGQTPS